MRSAKLEMEVETRQPCVLPINELVYADDTLVLAAGPYRAETRMRCIEAMGMNYGLRLKVKVKPARQWRARFRAQAQCENISTAIFLW